MCVCEPLEAKTKICVIITLIVHMFCYNTNCFLVLLSRLPQHHANMQKNFVMSAQVSFILVGEEKEIALIK